MVAAAFRGNNKMVRYLLERGADIGIQNRDGNTPLHVSAWAGKIETVELLIKNGADIHKKNNKKETARTIVSGPWSDEVAGVYRYISRVARVNFDLEKIKRARPLLVSYFDELASGDKED